MKNKLKYVVIIFLCFGFIASASSWSLLDQTNYGSVYSFGIDHSAGEIFVSAPNEDLIFDKSNLSQLNKVSSSESLEDAVFVNGHAYTVNSNDNDIRKYDLSGLSQSTVGTNDGVTNEYGIMDSYGSNKFIYMENSDNEYMEFDTTDNSESVAYNGNIDSQFSLNVRGNLLVASDRPNAVVYNLDTDSTKFSCDLSQYESGSSINNIYGIDYSPSQDYLAANYRDSDLNTYTKLINGSNCNEISDGSISDGLSAIRFSNNGQFLATADARLTVYDVLDGTFTEVYDPQPYGGKLRWADDDKTLWLGGNNNEIFKFNATNVKEPPSVSLNSPKNDYVGLSDKQVSYSFDVNSEGSQTDYTVYVDGNSVDNGSVTASASATTVTGSTSLSKGEHNMYIDVSNNAGTDTSVTKTFYVADFNKPADGSTQGTGISTNYNFSLETGSNSKNIDVEVTDPSGTTTDAFETSQSSNTNATHTFSKTYHNTGTYTWNVELDNSGIQGETYSFDVVTYNKPNITYTSPNSETVIDYDFKYTETFEFDISSDISGSWYLEVKTASDNSFKQIDSGSYSSGSNSFTSDKQLSLSQNTETVKWRVRTEDTFNTETHSSASYTVSQESPPQFSIDKPNDGELFWVENGGTVEIPFEGSISSSAEPGTAYARAEENVINGAFYSIKLSDIATNTDQDLSGSMTVGTTGKHINGRIDANLDSGATFSSNKVSFTVKNANPVIQSFNVTPSNFQNIEPGEYFDVSVNGDIKRDSVDKIKYDLDVGQNDAESFTKKPVDFQDQNQFIDSKNDAFQMKEAWRGEDLTITATVYDVNGLTDSRDVSGTTATPPKDYIFNKPNSGQVFLIPEGENEVEVDYDYGVDSAENGGTAKLIVNGVQKDSFGVSAKSSQTSTFSEKLTENDYTWTIKWTDSLTGLTYESGQRSFDVTEEPINLNLNNPNDGETTNLLDQNETSVDYKFNVDSRAHNGNYYYKFVLEDTTNNNVIRNTSSQDFSSGQRNHIQTVNGLEEASYNWNVKVLDSSTDTLLENKSSSYTIVKEPLFDLSLNDPSNNAIYQVKPGETTNVYSDYSVTTYADSVNLSLKLNGTEKDTKSVATQTSSSFNYNFTGLSPATYEANVSGKDEDGRTDSRSATFTVKEIEDKEDKDAEPYVTNAYFEPSISEAKVGDELDLVLEGTKTPEDVDFIDVEVETGAGTKTYVVPSSNLNETNSFITTIPAALTVTSAMIGEDVTISGALTSAAGKITDFFFDLLNAGSEGTLGAVLNYPVNDQPIKQPPGTSEDVRFSFNVNTLQKEADYSVLVDGESDDTPGTFSSVAGSETNSNLDPIPAESNKKVEIFRNMDSELFINQSRGNFSWKVKVYTGDGSSNDDSVEYSETEEFRILDSDVSTLNFKTPSQGEEIPLKEGANTSNLKFNFEADVNETGRLYLELKGDGPDATYNTIYNKNIGSGKKPDSEPEELEKGSYTAKLNFESDNLDLERTRDFAVVNKTTACDSANINLKKPTYETLYKDSEYFFEWSVCNPDEYVDSNATLYIEDDDENVVKSVKKEYDTQNEGIRFSERIITDFGVGEYTAYANLTYNNSEIKSNERSYEVVDFTKPESTNLIPDDANFGEGEKITLQWETQSYEENVELKAKVRRVGEYKASTVFSEDQSANSLQDYSDKITRDAGKYEWFIEMTVSPSGSPSDMTFTSNESTFLVESEDIQKADFRLNTPEQDAEYEIPNNSKNATVNFAFESRVHSVLDSDIRLKLEKVVDGEPQGYKRVRKWSQKGDEGFVPRNISRDLEEAGYRYHVEAVDPNGKTSYSANRSFIVNNPETEETPKVPTPEKSPGTAESISKTLNSGVGFLVTVLGTAGLFVLATVLTVLTGILVHQLTDGNDALSIISVLLTVFGFIYFQWLPGWLGFVLFMASAGVFMWIVRTATVGGGD